MNSQSLKFLNFNRNCIKPKDSIGILGGLAHNEQLLTLQLQDQQMDEPCCLQLATALGKCVSLTSLDCSNCLMGATGAALVCKKLDGMCLRLRSFKFNKNYMGPLSAIYISEILKKPECVMQLVHIADNDLMEEGGACIARSLLGNIVCTDVDLSSNYFTPMVGALLADAARGLFEVRKIFEYA